jgi:hypothetical protein
MKLAWSFLSPFGFFIALSRVWELSLGDVIAIATATGRALEPQRVTWLLGAGVILFLQVTSFGHRGIPLTVKHASAVLELLKPDGSHAIFTLEQSLRANHDNVTGYYREIFADGRVPKPSIKCHISHCGAGQQEIFYEGGEKSWRISHLFPAISRPFFDLGRATIQRKESMEYIDSFMNDEESVEFKVPASYRHHEVQLSVRFHPDRACDLKDCTGLLITESGGVRVDLEPLSRAGGSGPGVRATVKKFGKSAKLKIIWRYPPHIGVPANPAAPSQPAKPA